jgi:hypothetical protein
MDKYWSQVCTAQKNRPLSQLHHGSGIFAVNALLRFCCARVLLRPLMRRAGCFVRVYCSVQWDMVCAVGQDASLEAA